MPGPNSVTAAPGLTNARPPQARSRLGDEVRLSQATASKGSWVPSLGQSLVQYPGAALPSLPSEFSVLVWNAHKNEDPGFEREFQQLAGRSHLALLQEAVESLPVWDGFGCSYAISWADQEPKSSSGVATYSRAQQVSAELQRTEGREPVVGTPKVSLVSLFKVQGSDKQLMVVNTHALLMTSSNEQLQKLARVVRTHMAQGGSVIWAGDFNTKDEARHQYLLELTQSLGLHAPDWEGHRTTHHPFGPEIGDYPLEHLFASPDIHFQKAEALSSPVSDHNKLFAKIRIDP